MRWDDVKQALQFFEEGQEILLQVPTNGDVDMVRRFIIANMKTAPDRILPGELWYNRKGIFIVSLKDPHWEHWYKGHELVTFYIGWGRSDAWHNILQPMGYEWMEWYYTDQRVVELWDASKMSIRDAYWVIVNESWGHECALESIDDLYHYWGCKYGGYTNVSVR